MIPSLRGSVKTEGQKMLLPNPLTVCSAFGGEAVKAFADRMQKKNFVLNPAEDGFIRITINPAMEKEAYLLSVREDGIHIESSGKQGAIWALTTLFKMIDASGSVPACTIEDTPKMAHRGLHLDVARHFFTADEVKRIIEQIALAKMNVFHWHLADDQGWRIESRKYPKLHECSGDYYTQEEIRDVVSFAAARGVEVIPEIDMPGHTRGILAAYPKYSCSGKKVHLAKAGGIYRVILCAGSEKTYALIEDLLDEICPLFPSDRFHIGGDEAPKVEWQSCPVCRAKMDGEGISRYEDLQGYFSLRVSGILKKHGKRAILWNDSLESSFRPADIQMQYWSAAYNKPSAEYIARGGEWIYSDMFELYLDYPHAMTSVQKIYENQIDLGCCEWNPDHVPYGYEACVWTEHITENEELEKRIFPRIYVLAELAWYGAGDYAAFEDRLKEEMAEVEKAGISTAPYTGWNPQGQERRKEAFGYMEGLNMALPGEDRDEVVDPSNVGEDFQRKFMSRFFREEDLPLLMNVDG